jgi:two-component system NtrC family sensor kinase
MPVNYAIGETYQDTLTPEASLSRRNFNARAASAGSFLRPNTAGAGLNRVIRGKVSPMDQSPAPVRVVILGAGTGGAALLELFAHDRGIEVLGIADTNPTAPGLRLAKRFGVRTTGDCGELLSQTRADLIINATNDPAIDALLAQYRSAGTEVLGGIAARLMWKFAQHEQELRDQLIQTEKMATIGTFASGISHEINNPLYIMLGFSEHLRDETRPEVVREYTDAIIEAGQRIATIVRNLNAYAQRPRPVGLDDVDINQSLSEAIKMAGRATMQDDVSVVAEYGPVTPIRGKPEEFFQLFLNLVTNAVQAMNGRGTLTVTTRSLDGYVLATVKDTGPGIPPHQLPRIFDPFFTTKEPGKGTGLGLHIVREIVRGYGGQITVESTIGQGASFTVKLPSASGLSAAS